VTFSTPTGDFTQNPQGEGRVCKRDVTPTDSLALALWLLAITAHQDVTHLTDGTRRFVQH
jgi:hypothetical protein